MAVKRRAVVDSTAERKSFLESLPAQLKAVAKVRRTYVARARCTRRAQSWHLFAWSCKRLWDVVSMV
jgi:hypothetical protein